MAETVGEFLLRRLAQWGVRRVYGVPGEGVAGIVGALERGVAGIELVPARHEEGAAFMACAHARFGGDVGVCLAGAGPGAIHLLGGLYDAALNRQPVLAIVGELPGSAALDLGALLDDVAPGAVHRADAPQRVAERLDAALQTARGERRVACLIVPADVQQREAEPAAAPRGMNPPGPLAPGAQALRTAAATLNAGERVALLVGAGALHAGDEIVAVADRLAAGVAKTLAGKAAVPDELPFVTGPTGPIGSPPSRELMGECDTLLVVGARCRRRDALPAQARRVRIDIDPAAGAELLGDSRATLAALLPLLDRRADRRFREQIERSVARWWATLAAGAQDDAEPIRPQRVFGELSARLPERCIVTCEPGACAHWFARDVRLRRGMSAALSGALATPGSAVPYAVAAKYAQPGRPVVALLGDAAMQMSGINGLLTVAQVWREWANPRLVVMVLNSGDLDEAGWQRRLLEEEDAAPPEPPVEFPYAAYADLIGLRGIRVDHPQGVGAAWAAALGSDIPTLLEMVTDPRVSPLPPHASPEQLRAWRDALLAGGA